MVVGPPVDPNGATVEGGVVPQGLAHSPTTQHVFTMQICPLWQSAVVVQSLPQTSTSTQAWPPSAVFAQMQEANGPVVPHCVTGPSHVKPVVQTCSETSSVFIIRAYRAAVWRSRPLRIHRSRG
jgi:hypothetical protein